MNNLSDELIADLLLTKAMEEYSIKEKRFNDLNDVVDELFENGALDREEYLTSVMKLTQLGLMESDITTEEDIEMSEATGFDIKGITSKGMEYIDTLSKDATIGSKVKNFFNEFNGLCEKVVNNPVMRLTSEVVLPLLALLK